MNEFDVTITEYSETEVFTRSIKVEATDSLHAKMQGYPLVSMLAEKVEVNIVPKSEFVSIEAFTLKKLFRETKSLDNSVKGYVLFPKSGFSEDASEDERTYCVVSSPGEYEDEIIGTNITQTGKNINLTEQLKPWLVESVLVEKNLYYKLIGKK